MCIRGSAAKDARTPAVFFFSAALLQERAQGRRHCVGERFKNRGVGAGALRFLVKTSRSAGKRVYSARATWWMI